MTLGAKIAIGAGIYFLVARGRQTALNTRIAQASSPAAASAAALAGLERSLLNSFGQLLNQKQQQQPGGAGKGGGGGAPHSTPGGAGSGRSPGSSTAPDAIENAFEVVPVDTSGPGTLQAQVDAMAAITSADTPPPDLTVGADAATQAGVIDSIDLTSGLAPPPVFDPNADPNAGPNAAATDGYVPVPIDSSIGGDTGGDGGGDTGY